MVSSSVLQYRQKPIIGASSAKALDLPGSPAVSNETPISMCRGSAQETTANETSKLL
jgi:hypothetical protein